MEKISLLTLRRDLTRIRKRLIEGESFLVTDRGKVIAALQPITFGVDNDGERATVVGVTKNPDESVTVVHAEQVPFVDEAPKPRRLTRDEILRGVRSGKPVGEE